MCKFDLKGAYVIVPIHQSSRDFLTFLHRDIVYRYKRLAFGLNVAPRVFSKLMRYASEPLREEENQICILPRRHMYIGEDKRRDADTCLTDDIPFTRIGISIQ